MRLDNLLLDYKDKKPKIKKRLKDFSRLYKTSDENIFEELCFCILTSQSKAIYCDKAIRELKKSGFLFKGGKNSVRSKLKKVRFPNNKAGYIIQARKTFKDKNSFNIKDKLDPCNIQKTREWFIKNVKGLGYKEASHFLRNIGLGYDIAILDRHILKNLKKYKVINKIPSSLSKKNYMKIEDKFIKFSRKIDIPVQELDLLFWSEETGIIFK